MGGCVFCRIVAGDAPAEMVRVWPDAVAFTPLNPVTDGHVLVVPRIHVADFTTDPDVTGATAKRAAELAQAHDLVSANLITSKGRAATQSVFHLHLHLVPRRAGDGLLLPWSEPAVNTVEITASAGVFHTGTGAQHVHVGSR